MSSSNLRSFVGVTALCLLIAAAIAYFGTGNSQAVDRSPEDNTSPKPAGKLLD